MKKLAFNDNVIDMSHLLMHNWIASGFVLHSQVNTYTSYNGGHTNGVRAHTYRKNVLAKYDYDSKVQIPGYLVDLFSLMDSPRKDYQLGLIRFKMLWNGITDWGYLVILVRG